LATALGKDGFAGSQVSFFAECHGQHSAKMALPVPGFSIGPTLVVACCAKTVSIDVIPRKFPDPIGKAIGYLSQLGTHRRLSLALQVQTR
jgi:hypothetical protein